MITYSTSKDLDFRQISKMMGAEGWKHKDPGLLKKAVENSEYVVSAHDGNKVIGFGRIVSDGYFYAMIWDVIVDKDYRGKRIGTEIMRRLVDHLKEKKETYDLIGLFDASDNPKFYEKFGLEEFPKVIGRKLR